MARIAGVDLPRDKRVEIGLTYIYVIAEEFMCREGKNPPVSVSLQMQE